MGWFSKKPKTLGLALGGGGARGLVHIKVLKTLEEFGLRPKMITGASIGAIVGAIYCSGKEIDFIEAYVDRHIRLEGDRRHWREDGRRLLELVKLVDVDFSGSGLIKGERFSNILCDLLEGEDFTDFRIPLKVVATDYWESTQVVFESGPVLPAVQASMSVPAVFKPVEYQGRLLVDGACTNPVPWDLLDDCDVVIGVNALGRGKRPDNTRKPKAGKVGLEAYDIMQRGILAEKMRLDAPDYLVDPPITGLGLLDFHKADSVYEQSAQAIAGLRRFLETTF